MSFDAGSQIVFALAFSATLMIALWIVQFVTHDAGVVDVGWSGTLGVLAIFYAVTEPVGTYRTWIVSCLAVVWSFRLALYLLQDRILGKPEDGRYQKLRSGFGTRAQIFFFAFFQVQALLAWLFSMAFWLAMHRQGSLDGFDLCAIAVWIVAVAGESVADMQLARFRMEPSNRSKTCRVGLWRYSRHPNYFFEWLHWWVYVIFACTAPLGWLTLIGPALMLFFLFKVTGIPATEAQSVISRGDDYRDYQRTTSVFIPWWPKGA